MAKTSGSTLADPAKERLWTGATIITFARTLASMALSLVGIWHEDMTLLVIGLVVYWIGDSADGNYARFLKCETRIGASIDMICDRANCAMFYLGFVMLHHEMLLPVSVYLFEFMVVDMFLSLAFLMWPIRSPNYFYEVDRRIWIWNWSIPAKLINSNLFALLLLITGWWWLGLGIAVVLLGLKCVSLKWLFDLGLPIPGLDDTSDVADRINARVRAEAH